MRQFPPLFNGRLIVRVMNDPIYNHVRTNRQPVKWLQWTLNALTAFGQAILVLTGLVSIFFGFIWERSVCRLARHQGISPKSTE